MKKKYVLSPDNFNLLKQLDVSEMGKNIAFDDKERTVETSDRRTLLLIINDEIVSRGLEQEQCNEYGRKLYSLYDELYYQ